MGFGEKFFSWSKRPPKTVKKIESSLSEWRKPEDQVVAEARAGLSDFEKAKLDDSKQSLQPKEVPPATVQAIEQKGAVRAENEWFQEGEEMGASEKEVSLFGDAYKKAEAAARANKEQEEALVDQATAILPAQAQDAQEIRRTEALTEVISLDTRRTPRDQHAIQERATRAVSSEASTAEMSTQQIQHQIQELPTSEMSTEQMRRAE